MPDKISFSKRVIETLSAPSTGRIYIYDAKQANLCLCVTANRIRTWYWYGRVDGRPERIKIGRFPDVTVENARKAAAGYGGERAKGINPKRKRSTTTLQALFDYWLADAKLRKKTWEADEATWEYHFVGLRNRRLNTITTGDVARWHADIGKRRGTYIANRARALLSSVYGKAREFGFPGENPCRDVKRFREESRERFLLPDEMPPFFRAIAAEPPLWRDFWLLCLFTGARRGNVASMKWAEIDLSRGVWYLAGQRTKNGLPLAIVLPPQAVEILEARREAEPEAEWVFISAHTGGHIVDPRKSWRRILATAEIVNLRPHDLRRSLGSWQAMAGASLQIVGQSLGHRDPKATAVYSRLLMEPVRASVNGAVVKMIEASQPAKPKVKKGARHGKAK